MRRTWRYLEPGQLVAQFGKSQTERWVEAFHGVPFAAILIPEDTRACKMSLMMIGSCIILNCCNSKIAKCFTTLMRVAFFLHSQIVRSTVQQLHFSRFSAQQLRETQNNDASRGLSEETGWLWGGKIQNPPKPLIQVLHPSVAKESPCTAIYSA